MDHAIKLLPSDATMHEFRALVLFAEGKYHEAAEGIYAVLSMGPGWTWDTMMSLYPNEETYTRQLRARGLLPQEPERQRRPLPVGLSLPRDEPRARGGEST